MISMLLKVNAYLWHKIRLKTTKIFYCNIIKWPKKENFKKSIILSIIEIRLGNRIFYMYDIHVGMRIKFLNEEFK